MEKRKYIDWFFRRRDFCRRNGRRKRKGFWLFWLVIFFFLLGGFRIFAVNGDAIDSEKNEIEITLPEEIEEYLPEDIFDIDASEIYKSFDFSYFSETGLKLIAAAVPEATKNFAVLLGLLMIAACLRALRDIMTLPGLKTALELVGMLCICTAVFSVTETAFSLAESFIDSLSTFMAATVPTMTALMIASGNITSAAVMAGVIETALTVLGTICSGVLFPLIRLCLCLSAVSSVFGVTGLGGITPLIKKVIGYIFGFVALCLSAVLAFQGIISKSADSLALKGIKFAVGSFIPIVGSAVNEALSTIAGGIGTIKAATGVVGAVSVCLLAALPIIQLLMHKLFLELLSVCSGILGLGPEGKLISEMASFLGYTAAVMAVSSVFFILSLSVMAVSGM